MGDRSRIKLFLRKDAERHELRGHLDKQIAAGAAQPGRRELRIEEFETADQIDFGVKLRKFHEVH